MLPLHLRLAGASLRAVLSLPTSLLRKLVGEAPRNDRGHPLDLQAQVLLKLAAPRDPLRTGVKGMRRQLDTRGRAVDFVPAALHRVEHRSVPVPGGEVRVRLYTPTPSSGAPRPLCVYFHGGGWVIGSLDSHDGVLRELARRADCLVLSVDYRMAPEHRFPTAAQDAMAVFRWVLAHASELGVDPARIAVAGDSAGGNLAAVVAREALEDVCFQLLIYPVTDLTRSHESHRTYAKGFLLEKDTMDWFLENYLGGSMQEARSPLASPLWADVPKGLAPAYVVTAGFDPLRDEGEAYARKLAAAGVPVEARCEEGLIHGFFAMGGTVQAARAAVEHAVDALARGMRPRAKAVVAAAG